MTKVLMMINNDSIDRGLYIYRDKGVKFLDFNLDIETRKPQSTLVKYHIWSRQKAFVTRILF